MGRGSGMLLFASRLSFLVLWQIATGLGIPAYHLGNRWLILIAAYTGTWLGYGFRSLFRRFPPGVRLWLSSMATVAGVSVCHWLWRDPVVDFSGVILLLLGVMAAEKVWFERLENGQSKRATDGIYQNEPANEYSKGEG